MVPAAFQKDLSPCVFVLVRGDNVQHELYTKHLACTVLGDCRRWPLYIPDDVPHSFLRLLCFWRGDTSRDSMTYIKWTIYSRNTEKLYSAKARPTCQINANCQYNKQWTGPPVLDQNNGSSYQRDAVNMCVACATIMPMMYGYRYRTRTTLDTSTQFTNRVSTESQIYIPFL